jgi:hypothetical protein
MIPIIFTSCVPGRPLRLPEPERQLHQGTEWPDPNSGGRHQQYFGRLFTPINAITIDQ